MTAMDKSWDDFKVRVTIKVEHSIEVTLDARSNQSLDDIKVEALKRYHEIEKEQWRRQFLNVKTWLDVGSERSSIDSVQVTERR